MTHCQYFDAKSALAQSSLSHWSCLKKHIEFENRIKKGDI